jgi:hypothetical protein
MHNKFADGAYGSASYRFELLKKNAVLIVQVNKDANTSGSYYTQTIPLFFKKEVRVCRNY